MDIESGSVIALSSIDHMLAASLMLLLSLLSLLLRLGLEKKILIFSLRMTAQLLFIGLILRYLFASSSFILVFLLSMIMLFAAGREVWARQKRKIKGTAGYLISTGSMCISSFSVALIALL